MKEFSPSTEINSDIFGKQQFLWLFYFIISSWILLSGLFWFIVVFAEVIEKGRFPIESDPRFIKGWRLEFGVIAGLGMFYGSAIWLIITAIYAYFKEIKSHFSIFKMGLFALFFNIAISYFIFFSEIGKWILD